MEGVGLELLDVQRRPTARPPTYSGTTSSERTARVSGVGRKSGSAVTSPTTTGRPSRRQRPIRPTSRGWDHSRVASARKSVAAAGGALDVAVGAQPHGRAAVVAEGAVELLDDGLDDLADVGHGGRAACRARWRAASWRVRLRRRSPASSRASGQRRGGARHGGGRGAELRLEAARRTRARGASEKRLRLAAAALLLAVQQRAVGARDQLRSR